MNTNQVVVRIYLPDEDEESGVVQRTLVTTDPTQVAHWMATTLKNWCVDQDVSIFINGEKVN
jgi:hypothetical protein